jgi:hypothetical protein
VKRCYWGRSGGVRHRLQLNAAERGSCWSVTTTQEALMNAWQFSEPPLTTPQ